MSGSPSRVPATPFVLAVLLYHLVSGMRGMVLIVLVYVVDRLFVLFFIHHLFDPPLDVGGVAVSLSHLLYC